ncbi:MAG: RAMP superfamily CRISPR-associated protein [Chloroflexota bacterium]
MANERWDAATARGIREVLAVEGNLTLLTPVHLGNGDGDDQIDLPLLRDPLEGRPLLPGATLAGALRGYLQARQLGDRSAAARGSTGEIAWAACLFGGAREDDAGESSPVVVDDALANLPGIERRDGVKLDPRTRTAEDKKKFDLELWPSGITFPLRFELFLADGGAVGRLQRQALATALAGLDPAAGGIRLGARKHRGYGRVSVERWRVTRYDLTSPEGLIAWIAADDPAATAEAPGSTVEGPDLAALLDVPYLPDRRRRFEINATFGLDGSLLIRSETGQVAGGPDFSHLHARQPTGRLEPVLSGTSLAGALRARAARIAATFAGPASPRVQATIDDIFGPDLGPGVSPAASRLTVDEQVIVGGRSDLVQSRVAIDRFTGGVLPTALFSEQPVFGDREATVTVSLHLENPAEWETGLLLLVLKDLWTGDLPVGGEIGVGRGRLGGREAELRLRRAENDQAIWRISERDDRQLAVEGDRAVLERAVSALRQHLAEEAKA